MFDDYSTENCDDQHMSSLNFLDIFDNDSLWSLHYFPATENLIPFEDIFPPYLIPSNDPFSDQFCRTEDKVDESPVEKQPVIPRKRSGSTSKKDRHSKIDTARGLRDRRMRLSREVARKFFDLQDMLGVDKASKAIEWLLVQSGSAINALSSSASTSTGAKQGSILSGSNKMREQTQKDASVLRESREKARARAKQRTREKMLIQTLKASDHGELPK